MPDPTIQQVDEALAALNLFDHLLRDRQASDDPIGLKKKSIDRRKSYQEELDAFITSRDLIKPLIDVAEQHKLDAGSLRLFCKEAFVPPQIMDLAFTFNVFEALRKLKTTLEASTQRGEA